MHETLRGIFQDVFGVGPETFGDGLSNANVDGWDSIMHLTLILAIEQKFGVSFEPEIATQLTSVAAIKQALTAAGAA
jgi:acyl carrier protein